VFTPLFIFLVVGGIGFAFLMISLIIGDLFDALDFDFGVDFDFDADTDFDGSGGAGFGILDSRVISMFLVAFGFIGAIAVQLGVGGVLAALIGIGSGLILGGLVFSFGYYLVSQEGSPPVTNRELVGHAAKVIVDIKPESIGQISFNVREQRIDKLARTRDGKEIKAGEMVFIEEIVGNEFIVSSMDQMDYDLLTD
jgi:membrane protein implicated in regulation of membrane protease activity